LIEFLKVLGLFLYNASESGIIIFYIYPDLQICTICRKKTSFFTNQRTFLILSGFEKLEEVSKRGKYERSFYTEER